MMYQAEDMDEVDGAPLDRMADLPLKKDIHFQKESLDSGFGSFVSNPSDLGSLPSDSSLTVDFNRLELADKAFCKARSITESIEEGYGSISMRDREITSESPVKSLHTNCVSQPEKDYVQLFIPDNDGDSQLHLAIIQGHCQVAESIIDLAPTVYDLNRSGAQRLTALHLAVLTNQPRIVRHLLRAGAALEARNEDGNTPLHLACQLGHNECVQYLTQSCQLIPQDMDIKNYDGYTCMHLAAQHSRIEILKQLYSAAVGADVNARDGLSGRTVLHHAADMGNVRLVTFLTKLTGIHLNASAYNQNTPMQLAMGRGHEQVVRELEAAGASLETMESSSESDFSSEDDMMGDLDDIQINFHSSTMCTR